VPNRRLAALVRVEQAGAVLCSRLMLGNSWSNRCNGVSVRMLFVICSHHVLSEEGFTMLDNRLTSVTHVEGTDAKC
jgi:hypothetical protein